MEYQIYKDSSKPVTERVEDLLCKMTLEEKVGQLMQLDGTRGNLDEYVNGIHIGSLLHIQNEAAAKAMDMAAKTRLGIPILFGDDCIHGHSFHSGATIFPSQLAQAGSWNPELIEKAARVTAKEVRLTGLKWTFSPVLCLARDLRWGRINETFGEDPFLIGEFATAMIRGYQGKGLDDSEAIMATAKHYAGYSETQGGRDASEADISRRKLRSFFLPPFERAAREGCMSFMTGYQSIEGVPTTANRWLLNDVLKEEWGFEGILVTDWDNVGRMHWEQKICATLKDAATLAVKSGNDLMMATRGFFEAALEAIAEGLLSEEEIDALVRRLLSLKFKLGLFEDPGKPDLAKQKIVIGCEEHKNINLELARESLILLKNDGILPLADNKSLKIAVVGPNADSQHELLGDWAGASGQVDWIKDGHPRECHKTVLDGIREIAPKGSQITYAKGSDISIVVEIDDDDGEVKKTQRILANPCKEMIDAAVEAVNSSDIAVIVLGDDRVLYGEYASTATLELQGGQKELVSAVAATGKPMIVVLINSKPLVLPEEVLNSAAIIEAFNPGMQGGLAIAEAMFGKFNPSGKLTISFPYHVGQQPIYYSQIRGQHGNNYADMTQSPLFAFGEGMSYTSYKYSDLKVISKELTMDQTLKCEVTISNTGFCDGVEIAQLYTSDLVTSATWVNHELKAYKRVALKSGESKTVKFEVPVKELSIVNAACERVVEPGEFEVQVGPNSRDESLLKAVFTVVE